MRLALRISFLLLLLSGRQLYSQVLKPDTIKSSDPSGEVFYDSLKVKAYRHGLTKFMYKNIIVEREGPQDLDFQYRLLRKNRGKTIASVHLVPLDVFGPSFQDTARRPEFKIGEIGNRLHTTTNPKIIQKNILMEVGDTIDVAKILENERIFRSLPYIKDARFMVSPSEKDTNMVDLTVLTKDVFSFGIDMNLNGTESGSFELYNQNIWGIGHQISGKLVRHSSKKPHVGFEGAYSIANINGNFVNISAGWFNTYKRRGVKLNFEKEFLLSTTKWGGGLSLYRLGRSDHLMDYDDVNTDYPLDYGALDIWGGYGFLLNNTSSSGNLQLVISGRFRHLKFYDRPEPDPGNRQYYSGSRLFMGSISLSKRNYIRDYLVFSYGVTEDIPRGFLHEWAFGFDNNEFTDRWYSHLYFSTGSLIRYKPSYLFASVGVGGFFNAQRLEQGQIEFKSNYISRLYNVGQQRFRQFVRLRYLCGLKRFDEETLYLKDKDGIRGFYSEVATGKKRLALNLETVLFTRKTVAGFNVAFFGFGDLGIIGSEKKSVFRGDYYSGIGGGIRIKNENLVFRTIQIRLAYYPNHPVDNSGFGFIFTEMGHNDFYSFQPRKPETLRYK